MGFLLFFCLLGFAGLWLFFHLLGWVFKLVFAVLGGVLGLAGGLFTVAAVGTSLLVAGVVGLVLLPVLGLFLLPLAFPVLFLLGLVWLLSGGHHRAHRVAL